MKDRSFPLTEKDLRILLFFEITGFIFNIFTAIVLHFLYQWSDKELFTALFSAVNESVWEHIKIFTLPYVVWGFAELFCLPVTFRRLIVSKVAGLYFIIITIPAFFYTFIFFAGKNITIIDIISGFVITALSYVISYCLISRLKYVDRYYRASLALFVLYCVCIAFFTFAPPKSALFRDPITGTFGLQ